MSRRGRWDGPAEHVALKGAKDVDERVDLAEMADVGGFFQGVWPMAPTSTYSTEAWVSFFGL